MKSLLTLFKEDKLIAFAMQRSSYGGMERHGEELIELAKHLKNSLIKYTTKKSTINNLRKAWNVESHIMWLVVIAKNIWFNQYKNKGKDFSKYLEKIESIIYLTEKEESIVYQWLLKGKVLFQDEKELNQFECFIQDYLSEKTKISSIEKRVSNISHQYIETLENLRESSGVIFPKNYLFKGLNKKEIKEFLDNGEHFGIESPVVLVGEESNRYYLTYLEDTKDREKLFESSFNVGSLEKLFDKSVECRFKNARNKGFKNYVDYNSQNMIFDNSNKIQEWLSTQLKKYEKGYYKELADIQKLAKKDGIQDVKPWDILYYQNKLTKDSNAIYSNVFNLDNVIELVAQELENDFGVNVKTIKTKKKNNYTLKIHSPILNRTMYMYLVTDTGDDNPFYMEITVPLNGWGKHSMSGVINLSLQNEISFQDLVCLFHEVGHAMNQFCAESPLYHRKNFAFEVSEVASLLYEEKVFSTDVLKKLSYKGKNLTNLKMNKMFEHFEYISRDFIKYMDVKKWIVLNELFSREDPFTFQDIKKEFIDNKIVDLFLEDSFLINNTYSKYSTCCWTYELSNNISQNILKEMKKFDKIKDKINYYNYLYGHVLSAGVLSNEKEKIKENKFL